jgi:hypothetical protein
MLSSTRSSTDSPRLSHEGEGPLPSQHSNSPTQFCTLQEFLNNQKGLNHSKNRHYYGWITSIVLGALAFTVFLLVTRRLLNTSFPLQAALIGSGATGAVVTILIGGLVTINYLVVIPRKKEEVSTGNLVVSMRYTATIIKAGSTAKGDHIRNLRDILDTYTDKQWIKLIVGINTHLAHNDSTHLARDDRDTLTLDISTKDSHQVIAYKLLLAANPVKFIHNYYEAKRLAKLETILPKDKIFIEKLIGSVLNGLSDKEWTQLVTPLREKVNPSLRGYRPEEGLECILDNTDRKRFQLTYKHVGWEEPSGDSLLSHFHRDREALIRARVQRIRLLAFTVLSALAVAIATYFLLTQALHLNLNLTGSVILPVAAGALVAVAGSFIALHFTSEIREKVEKTSVKALHKALTDRDFPLETLKSKNHWSYSRFQEMMAEYTDEEWQGLIAYFQTATIRGDEAKKQKYRLDNFKALLNANPYKFMLNYYTYLQVNNPSLTDYAMLEGAFVEILKNKSAEEWDKMVSDIDNRLCTPETAEGAYHLARLLVNYGSNEFIDAFRKHTDWKSTDLLIIAKISIFEKLPRDLSTLSGANRNELIYLIKGTYFKDDDDKVRQREGEILEQLQMVSPTGFAEFLAKKKEGNYEFLKTFRMNLLRPNRKIKVDRNLPKEEKQRLRTKTYTTRVIAYYALKKRDLFTEDQKAVGEALINGFGEPKIDEQIGNALADLSNEDWGIMLSYINEKFFAWGVEETGIYKQFINAMIQINEDRYNTVCQNHSPRWGTDFKKFLGTVKKIVPQE